MFWISFVELDGHKAAVGNHRSRAWLALGLALASELYRARPRATLRRIQKLITELGILPEALGGYSILLCHLKKQ